MLTPVKKASWFQSYLYGIEMVVVVVVVVVGGSFNRTFMELKFQLTASGTNMGLTFQSYLYGIEISILYAIGFSFV